MKRLNFSYNGAILEAKASKPVIVFLIIAFLMLQIDYAYCDNTKTKEPNPSSRKSEIVPPGNSANEHSPFPPRSSSASSMLTTSGGSSGSSSSGFASPSLIGPLGTTREIFQTDLFTGRASSVIPIVVPAGRGNAQPDIKLSHSSGGGNSWCGVGWELGLGSIERSTKKGVPTYDNSRDTFSATLNGIVSDLVDVGGGDYRAKFDSSFLRFHYTGTYWEVWDKSGTKYLFGTSAGSRVENTYGIYKWCFDKVVDINGNYMTISYTKDEGEIYPDLIQYTGNENTGDTPKRSVKFNLESVARPDTFENYRSGSKIATRYRLANVEVRDNGNLVRKYELNYSTSPNTYRSLLTSVVQYGSDGISTLPPVTFTYQSGMNGWREDSAWIIPDGSFVEGNNDQGRVLVDVNGDTLPELMVAIAYQYGSWNERSYKNTGNGWVYDAGWNAPNGNFIWVTQGIHIDDGRRLADVTGDGFPDWLVANKYWYGGGDYSRGSYLNGQTYWQTTSSSQWNIPDGYFAEIGADKGRRLADINGDGLIDLSISKDGYRATYLNNGNGWTQDNSWNVPDGDFSKGAQLIDINGDGLTDLLIALDGTKASYVNNGKGWTRDDTWNIPDGNFVESDKAAGRVLFDINGDGLPDLVIAKDGYKATYINTGHGWTRDDRWNIPDGDIVAGGQDKGRRLSDVNGDGMTDLIIAEGSYKKTYLNSSPVPDLLSAISNGIGGTTAISYTPSTRYYNNGPDSICDLPILLQTVSSVSRSDGLGHTYTVTYNYWDGKFDVREREFLGFDHVREIDADGNYADSWFKQDPRYKGRLYMQEKKDIFGNFYARIWNYWDSFEPYPGAYVAVLKWQDQYVYDGDEIFKRTQVSYEYDSYGNVNKISYSGDDTAGWGTILGDEKYVYVEYVYNSAKWLLDKPSHTYVTDSNGVKVSEAWYYYDGNSSWYGITPTLGRLTKEERWLNTGPNPTTSMDYDDYGNVKSVRDVKGRTTTTTYDNVYHAFPEVVTNDVGHTQRFTYDPKTSQILTSTDPNGQVTTNEYDVFGRTIKAFTPYDDALHPSVWYEYGITTFPSKITVHSREENNTDDPNKIRTTYTFFDGLGRTIEVKSEAEDPAKQIVSGIANFNNRGLVESKYLPYSINISTPQEAAGYSAPDLTGPKASFQYDPVGRLVKTINPDSTYSTITYSDWLVTSTDENGHRKRSTRDAYGRIIMVEEFNGAQIYTTTYEYDTLGNLIHTVDALGNIVSIEYDTLSRKISMNDPDMGSWSYDYDDVGNLIEQTDAKLQSLKFEYDALNRITKKDYPSGTDVIYTYDTYPTGVTPGPYSTGRLTSVTDSSGRTIFYYDKLGRETQTLKIIDGISYTTSREYDGRDRLKSITYPDGETVNYTYNRQGGIETVVGNETYVANVDYNAQGQMVLIRYGNNTQTVYEYDPGTLRLSHLDTQNGQGLKLQDLTYGFDNVGNVKTIRDDSANGTNTQSFNYDDLDRLTQAIGESYGTIDYQYDPIGNITQKGNLELIYPVAGSQRPHAVKEVKRNGEILYTPTYDANGNMTQKGNQVFQYDYENRLVQVSDPQSSGLVTVEISLRPGVNFFSLPVIPQDAKISSVFSSLSFGTDYIQVSRYNSVTKSFEHYVNNPKFNQFDTLEYGVGYEIYISNPNGCLLTITGYLPSQQETIVLSQGWNLIGSPTRDSINIPDALRTLQHGVDYDVLIRYNHSLGTFEYFYNNPSTNQFSSMEKGYSYFIHALRDTIWQVPIEYSGATSFTYDGDGGRVKKTTPDGVTTTYIGSLYEIVQVPSQGQRITKSIFLGLNRICQIESNNVYYLHQDHIGSSNSVTDSSGNQVALYEYSPYGESSRVNEGSFSTDVRFTGKRLDSSTNLYYYGARYYDPELGRFITADPTIQRPFDPQDLNRYSYCRNNPINYTDPTGLGFWSWLKKAWQSILGIASTIISILVPPLAPAMMAMNFAISAFTAIQSGNILGLVGGIAGGMVFGAIGKGIALSMAAGMGDFAWSFGGGAIGGAIEFGLGGFGAGFGSALASGEKLSDSLIAGGWGAAFGAATGAAIQGSYMAGWQDALHGLSREDISFAQAGGRFPTTAERAQLESAFPGLKGTKFKITGEPTRKYNCIAWTLGETDRWINPTNTVGGMDRLYRAVGYKTVSERKAAIALFVKYGEPTHGALRVSGNLYESKLGSWYRITHPLRALEGEIYGYVEKFYGK